MLHSDSVRLRDYVFAATLVSACFLLYLRRPYSVVSDMGYQAFSAWQYAHHETAHFLSITLVNPRNLAENIESPLYAWSPSWSFLFFLAFKSGLAAGTAGRILGYLLSLIGAAGWVGVVSVLGLKGRWRIAGIAMAALYCMRSRSETLLGAGDLIVYAAAPWLLAAAIHIALRLRGSRSRNVVRDTALLSLALGAVYWLKYSGVFLGIAIFCFLVLQHIRANWPRLAPTVGVVALCGAAFLAPILAAKIYNLERSGADAVEAAVKSNRSPTRTWKRLGLMVYEAAFTSSAALFSSGEGADWLAHKFDVHYEPNSEDWHGFAFRIPGLLLFGVLLYVAWFCWPPYVFDLTLMLVAVPFAGFPVVSFIAGDKFTFAMGRCCEPFWIFLELAAFLVLAQGAGSAAPAIRLARNVLAGLVAIELVFFLISPALAVSEIKRVLSWPSYRMGEARLWVTDLSRWGARDIDDKVKSMVRGPQDIVVPAVYSNRSFGMDLWLEYSHYRLLPLTTFASPLWKTHGADGANYDSTRPFVSSSPVRVVLVLSDTFNSPEFPASVERIKKRFPQALSWTRGPLDPDNRVEIWAADLR